MNVTTTKLPPERLDPVDIERFGIIAYGNNNLYPQHLKRIVQASGTETLCLKRMQSSWRVSALTLNWLPCQ